VQAFDLGRPNRGILMTLTRTRRWPWWLRSPHSRLFSEWIELKTDQHTEEPERDAHAPAA